VYSFNPSRHIQQKKAGHKSACHDDKSPAQKIKQSVFHFSSGKKKGGRVRTVSGGMPNKEFPPPFQLMSYVFIGPHFLPLAYILSLDFVFVKFILFRRC